MSSYATNVYPMPPGYAAYPLPPAQGATVPGAMPLMPAPTAYGPQPTYGPQTTYSPQPPYAPPAVHLPSPAYYPAVPMPAPVAMLPPGMPPMPPAVVAPGVPQTQGWNLFQELHGAVQDFLRFLQNGLSHVLPSPTPQPPQTPSNPSTPPSSKGKAEFVVSSFNILGSTHTAPGGDAKGYASGPARMHQAVALLRTRQVDVVGFQEMNADQAKEFREVAGQEFGLYPGNTLGGRGSLNSIAWRKEEFALVKAYTVQMPSHRGEMRHVPVVRLRNKETGQEAFFVNVHNAPGFHKGGAQQNWRDKATDMQVALINQLKRETGLPVILTGDMNEKLTYFNRMQREADMDAANQRPNDQPPKNMGIDWIFGSEGVKFKGFVRDASTKQRKISDHALIMSEVKLRAPNETLP